MHFAILNFADFSVIDLELQGRTASFESFFVSKNEERKKSYWAARYAAAFLMRKVGIDATIKHDASFGFPVLVNKKGEVVGSHYISLAHTENVAIVAISKQPIGIDLEKTDRNAKNVIDRILSQEEKKLFSTLPKKIRVDETEIEKSLLFWVLKESVAKASGLGMTRGLDIFEISDSKKGNYKTTAPKDAPHPLNNPLCKPFIVDNYVLSVCASEDSFNGGIFGRFFRLLDLNGKFEELDGLKDSQSH